MDYKKKVTGLLSRNTTYWGETEFELPEDIALRTGYTKAIGLVFDNQVRKPCSVNKCDRDAWSLQCRITKVVDVKGQEVSVNHLTPEVSKIIQETITEVGICSKHLMERFCDAADEDRDD